MREIESALRDELHQVSRNVVPSDRFLSDTLTKSRASHSRVAGVLIPIGGVLAAVAIVAGFVALRGEPTETESVALVAIDPSVNLECDRQAEAADLSPSQQSLSRMRVVAMTVCTWTNASTGDPTADRHSTLAGETVLDQPASEQLVAALTGAARAHPRSLCMMIDSPPTPIYYVRIQDVRAEQWGVSIPHPSCLGFRLSGGTRYGSEEALNLLGSLAQDE